MEISISESESRYQKKRNIIKKQRPKDHKPSTSKQDFHNDISKEGEEFYSFYCQKYPQKDFDVWRRKSFESSELYQLAEAIHSKDKMEQYYGMMT